MNETIRSILAILEHDRPPELKIAAAQVLGELAPKEVGVVKALAAQLDNGADFVARHVLATLAAIGSAAATRVLVGQLDGRHADLAAHLLAEIGEAAVPALADAFDAAGPESRLRILGILARSSGPRVAQVAEQAIQLPEFGKRAAEVLVHAAAALDGRQLKPLKVRLTKALAGDEVAPQCAAAILSVLARLDAAGSRATLLKYAGPDHAAMVRQSALQALRDIRLTPTQAAALLPLLHEDDEVHVVEPALRLLERVEGWPEQALPELRRMLGGRLPRLRLFAVRAVRHAPRADQVKPLLQFLHGQDAELASAASAALGANPDAAAPLLRSLLVEKDPARARRTAEPLVRLGRDFAAKDVKSLAERGVKLLLAHDPVGEILLGLLVRAQPEKGAAAVVERAVRFRKQRKFAEAVALLAFLAAADRLDGEGRYQLALCRLLLDVAAHRDGHATAGDATMGYFALLIRDRFPVLDRIKRESMLEPEDLLRVGQHFTDAVGEERRFGTALLLHLADKHPRRRAGEEARQVLRIEGR
jgi:hypothetical protein